jgi:hypothetical protein
MRAHGNRALPMASLVKIIKGQWRCVNPIFVNELDEQEDQAPGKSKAIRSWQRADGYNPLWNGREAVVTPKGRWKPMAEWTAGDLENDASVEGFLLTISADLQIILQKGDQVCFEVCSGLIVMHRDFSPYNGTTNAKNMMPFQKVKYLRSFVSVSQNKSRHRTAKCAGQVMEVCRIKVRRGDQTIANEEACRLVLFKIKHERLASMNYVVGQNDDAPSKMSIIDEPFSIWNCRNSPHRPRLIRLSEIFSACLTVPRVGVPALAPIDADPDIRKHAYHLIQLRRDKLAS